MSSSKKITDVLIKNLFFVLVIVILAGCGGDKAVTVSPTATPLIKWTVMVYMALDNDLSIHADPNIIEMQKSGSTDYVNIVALVDTPTVNTKRYLVKYSPDSTTVVSPYYDYGENIDTGNVNNLKSFVTAACSAYPAQNYMLILSGHGGGIMDSKSLSAAVKNICSDDTSHNAITVPELGSALNELTASTPIKVVATDACIMGMFEISYELKNANINYLVLSETTIPGTGYPYDGSWLSGINSATTDLELTTNLVNGYYDYYVAKAEESITLSAINLERFANDGLINKYNSLATALNNLGDADLDTVKDTVIPATQHFAPLTSQYWYNYQDLRDFCRKLIDNNIAPTEATALYNDLAVGDNNVVIISKAYTGTRAGQLNIINANGMSTLICNPGFTSYATNWQGYYENLKYYTDGNVNWASFLSKVAP